MNPHPGNREVHLPPRLAARPIDPRRGLPIPYVNEHDEGSVNFALINGGRVLECVRRRLCGQPHEHRIAFIGGPGGFHERMYTDPPGHACAQPWTSAGTWPSNATVAAG